MALLKGLFMFFMRQTIIVVSRYIEYDLKNDIYKHYQELDYNFYATNNTGDLMNRISEDVSRVRMYVGPAIMYTVNLVVMFILVIYAMAQVNLELTLFTLLPLPILSAIIYYVEDIINRKSEKVQGLLSGLSTSVQEAFSGIRILKSYAREHYNHEQFSKQANDYKSGIHGPCKGERHLSSGIADFNRTEYYINYLCGWIESDGWIGLPLEILLNSSFM
jgi:ATP-binding cassette subfamily B protein